MITNKMVSFMGNTTQNFKLPRNYSLEISGIYEGPSAYFAARYSELWQVSAGLQKTILKGNGSLRLNATDIFWSYVYYGETQLGDNMINDFYRWDNRVITGTFTYNFGKKSFALKDNSVELPNSGKNRK
jgi:hypothetical protein